MSSDDEIKIQRLQKLLLDPEISKFVFNGLKETLNEHLQSTTDYQDKLEKLYPEGNTTPLGSLGKLVLHSINDNLKSNLIMYLVLETVNRNLLENRKTERTSNSKIDAQDFLNEYRSNLRFLKRQHEDIARDTTTE